MLVGEATTRQMKGDRAVRLFLGLAFMGLSMTACSVDRDGGNDQVTLQYNEQRIREGAARAGNTAREIGSSAGNIMSATGSAIRNEVGDIDVDVRRTPRQQGEPQQGERQPAEPRQAQ